MQFYIFSVKQQLFLLTQETEGETSGRFHEQKFEQQNMNRNNEEAEEYGVRDVTVGNGYMDIRHIEKRYSATNWNTRPKERRKEEKTKICENEKAYVLVNIIKTEKHTNNWISSTNSNAQIFLHGA